MFISHFPPYRFTDNDILAPSAVYENGNYFAKALQFIADQQTCRWTTTFELNPSVSTPLTSTSATALLLRDIPPNNFRVVGATGGTGGSSRTSPVFIESVSVTAFYQATVPFELAIGPSGSAVDETITFPARSAADALEPYQVVRLMNVNHNGTRDLFRLRDPVLVAGGSFGASLPAGVTITKFDVTFGFASDKYLSGNRINNTSITKPNYTPGNVSDVTIADAAGFSIGKSLIETAATDAINGFPFRWSVVDFYNITQATDVRLRTIPILPGWQDAAFTSPIVNNPNVVGIWFEYASTSPAGNITVSYVNNLLATQGIYTNTGAVAATGSGGIMSAAGANQLRVAATDATANDRYITISLSSATPTITRLTAYVIYQ